MLHASLKIAAQEAFKRGDLVAAGELSAEADGIEADLLASARFALERVEAEACYTRTGHHSSTTGEWRDGAGLIAPTFTHHISRDGDPQLHVHIAIATMVQRADGEDEKWRKPDMRALYNQRLSIAAQTDREMESRMIARGYAMVPREDGNGCEVGGVSRQVMDLFSSRTAALSPELDAMVAAYERKYGHPPSKRTRWLMDQQAADKTRRPKAAARKIHGTSGGDADEAGRLTAWEAQTAAAEMTALSQVHTDVAAFGSRPAAVIDEDMKAMAARAAVAEVQQHHAVWSLSELRFEVGRALPPGASPELVREVADLAVAPGAGTGVLLVTAPEVTDVTPLGTRKDGTSIYRPPNEARYTTTGQVDLEERILRQAAKPVPPRVSEGMARRALEGSGLTREQEDAAVRLLTSTTMVSILTAAAGAGKTHTVAAYASARTRLTGKRVIGITTAENAARQMAEEGLAEVYNSAAFLGRVKGSDLLRYPVPLAPGDVLVLDESSMISTADLALIMDYADRAGAQVVPTGDNSQLGPVEAGGMFRALVRELGAAELSEVMRFDQQWERDASLRLRDGDKGVTAAYDRRGRIRGDHREAAYARAAGAWLADHLHGKDALLLAGSNEEAAELARLVQAQLVKMGTVVQPRAPLADGNRAGTGDLIRARLNTQIDAGGQRLTNRDVLRIEGWQGADAEVTRRTADGWSARFLVPRSYLAESAELHYAGNIHVAQGRTADTSHVLVTDSLSRQSFYVGMSRGRESNMAHVVTGETAPAGAEPYQQAPPEAVIHQVMERDAEELSAVEQIRHSQEWASGTGHVLNLWTAAIREKFNPSVDREFRQVLSESEYARYEREHQRPALLEALRGRMLAGQDIRAAIREITRAPMDGARSVTAVLHHRLGELAKPDAPMSWAARTPEGAGEIAQATAEALDSRTAALGDRLLTEPEPWVMRHLGPPPREVKPGLQAMLEADYSRRAGIAQSYREAAGITDPHQVIRWDGHKGNPELEAMRQDTIRALQIRDEQADLAGLDRGQLEVKAIAGARARAAAPRDVSTELRGAARLETDLRVQGAEALARGADAAVYDLAADQMAADRAELEAANADYEAWSDSTARTREIAEKAQRELERRGYQVPEWAPENESPERQADEPEGQVDAPEVEADAPEVEADEPVMPEPETNEPEAADSAGPEPEPEPARPSCACLERGEELTVTGEHCVRLREQLLTAAFASVRLGAGRGRVG